jgi:hypothetical protein
MMHDNMNVKFGNLLTKNALPPIEENWKEVYIESFSRILNSLFRPL